MLMADIVRTTARHLRNVALTGLSAVGGFDRIADSPWRRKRLLVLCYHGVSLRDEHEWNPELFVTPAFLRRRFEILRDRGYSVLPLDEALARCANGTLPARSVVITFDDGLSDFAQLVAPLLGEFGYPATVYVTTYYSEKQWPVVPPILGYLLWKAGERLHSFEWPSAAIRHVASDDLPTKRRTILGRLERYADDRAMSGYERWDLTKSVAEKLGVDLATILRQRVLHIMTSDEIRSVASQGVDVQLHTHRHRVPRDPVLFEAEILENRRRLEALTGRKAEHFCYPNGVVFQECLPWLRHLGIASATTCESGLYSPALDPLLMPRFIDTLGQSELVFESWLSGASAALRLGGRSLLRLGAGGGRRYKVA
jgi:peptidoglycan/xylan/chitin deacetylase (PgdA/CDA1 family)